MLSENRRIIFFSMIGKEKSKGNSYKLSQIFGFKKNEKIHEEDIVTSLKFDNTGNYICIGDKAGRLILFKSDERNKQQKYEYYSEFQVYTREFDPLNSSEIEEQILGIHWMRPQGDYQKILTMNSKTIKLWKIFQRNQKKIMKINASESLPKVINSTSFPSLKMQNSFGKSLDEDLIAMDLTENEEYILNTDGYSIVLRNFEKANVPFLITDMKKGKSIDQVKEQITFLKSHPYSDCIMAYGTNRGSTVLSDTRVGIFLPKAGSKNAIVMKYQFAGKKSFFTQMLSSVSSFTFLNNGKYIAVRDYLTVKIWDVAKHDRPIAAIVTQESLKSKLSEMFENDSIFDKFSISRSKDSNTLLTGNYNNSFHLIDVEDLQNTQYELNYKKQTISKLINPSRPNNLPSKMDYARKTAVCDFHPQKNMLAVASLNCFLTYTM